MFSLFRERQRDKKRVRDRDTEGGVECGCGSPLTVRRGWIGGALVCLVYLVCELSFFIYLRFV